MPRLPDVTDYGARPSLRSNRVDPVHDGSAVAESVAQATEQFARIYGEVQAKEDRLKYQLAKNELTSLDIEQREGLKDRTDWQAFDEDYTTGFNDGRDEILARYDLNPSDATLLSSESEVIRERGRVYTNDLARKHEIDQGRSQVHADLERMSRQIQDAPPAQQNQLMLDALEMITAASDPEGKTPWFTREEAINEIQTFVSNAAISSLEAMDAETRIAELELSLAHRKARGSIDREDIAKGEGSGSIADFLHSNIAERILRSAKRENEAENELAAAQALVDEIEANNPGDPEAIIRETKKAARERGLDAGARARAESMSRQIATDIRTNRNFERSERMVALGELLRNGTPYNSLKPDQLSGLTPGQISTLEEFEAMLLNNKQFAPATNWRQPVYGEDDQLEKPSYSAWIRMSPEEKAAQNLEDPMWKTNFDLRVWKQLADDQDRIRNGRSSKGESEKSWQTLDQIVTDVWAGELGLPRTGRDEDEDQMYYMMRSQVAEEIDRVSDSEYNSKDVPDARRKDIAREVMSRQVFERDVGLRGHIYGRDSTDPIPISEVDPDHYRDYFVPMHMWKDLDTTILIGPNKEPVSMTWEDRLRRRAELVRGDTNVDPRDLENAYGQIRIGGDPQDVMRRVDEALKGEYEY